MGRAARELLTRADDCSCPAQTSSRNQPPFYFLGGSFFFQTVNRKNFKKQKTKKRKKKKKILVHEIKIFFIAWSSLLWISLIAFSTPGIPFKTTAKPQILRVEG